MLVVWKWRTKFATKIYEVAFPFGLLSGEEIFSVKGGDEKGCAAAAGTSISLRSTK